MAKCSSCKELYDKKVFSCIGNLCKECYALDQERRFHKGDKEIYAFHYCIDCGSLIRITDCEPTASPIAYRIEVCDTCKANRDKKGSLERWL